MLAHYGFKDGSGDWFLIIDTDKCNGCAKCVEVCPGNVLEIGEDEYEPFREEAVAKVRHKERNAAACELGAISHSDGWKLMCGK